MVVLVASFTVVASFQEMHPALAGLRPDVAFVGDKNVALAAAWTFYRYNEMWTARCGPRSSPRR